MICSACDKEAKYLSHYGDCSDGAYCEQCAMDKFVKDKSQFCYCNRCSEECSYGVYFFDGHSFCSKDCIKDYIEERYLENEIDIEDIDSLEKIKFCDCLYCGCPCKNGIHWYDFNSFCSLECIMRENEFWTVEDIDDIIENKKQAW